MWWAILIHLAVFIAFNSPWQILTLPANTTIWSRRWNRIATVNTTTLGLGHRRRTWNRSDLSCGHFTIGSFSCCDTILLEKCENSCQKCAKVLQPNTTTGHEPDQIYLAVTLLSERWCGREEKIFFSCCDKILFEKCGVYCQKCANSFFAVEGLILSNAKKCALLWTQILTQIISFSLQISK